MTADAFPHRVQTLSSTPQASRIRSHRRGIHLVDAGAVLASVALTLAVGVGEGADLGHDRPRQVLALSLALVWPFMLWQRQSSATTILGQGAEEYRRVLVSCGSTLLATAAVAYFLAAEPRRVYLLVTVAIGTAFLLLGRHLMRLRLHRLMAAGHPLHRVFVIAAPARAEEISAQLDNKDRRYRQVGVWHLRVHGDPDPATIVEQATALGADTILYAPLGTEHSHWTRRLGWAMEDTDLSLLVSPSITEIAGPRLTVEPVEGLAFVRVDMPKFSGPAQVTKRVLDIVGSLLALLILGLPMLVIALLIRRDSHGPALFKQVRAGAGSSTFVCWKFRTMFLGADAQRAALRAEQGAAAQDQESATFKMEDDPRVTRLGRTLRRYSMDELPQFVNVLRGEMSLVGPRPHPLDDVERYDDVATRRLLARPGMTGLWQVSGRSELSWEEAVRLDLHYVENWSLATDILILLRTVKVVVAGSGAY
jgi:exopolysaccharide biosynthesis polyprenyl glycosylphosphotransferase